MKHVKKELQVVTGRSNERLIVNLLTSVDELRAIETGRTMENVNSLLQGVKMVYKKLCKKLVLKLEGLIRRGAVRKPFDSNIHEILCRYLNQHHENGMVVEESRKGFMFKSKL